jgi:hypothetical protein
MVSRATWAACVLAGALLLPAGARADERTEAREAYQRGLTAAEQGDLRGAAEAFARADELMPSAVALTSALKAALDADAGDIALELAERSAQRVPDQSDEGNFAPLVLKAHERHDGRFGVLVVRCAPAVRCELQIDGRDVEVGSKRWLTVGEHALSGRVDDEPRRQTVRIAAGQTQQIEWQPPVKQPAEPRGAQATAPPPPVPARAAPPTEQSAQSSGISPAWFAVGAGLTAALAAGTIASAVDTRNKHRDFEATGAGADAGRTSQTRTNALFFGTLAVGLGSAAIGIFAVDWSAGDSGVALRMGPMGGRIEARW